MVLRGHLGPEWLGGLASSGRSSMIGFSTRDPLFSRAHLPNDHDLIPISLMFGVLVAYAVTKAKGGDKRERGLSVGPGNSVVVRVSK